MSTTVLNQSLPKNWAITYLDEIRLNRSRNIVPNKVKDQIFELYSVPSYDDKKPEIVSGNEIGSNKQIVEEETVLLCKINPRINRVWIVGNYSSHPKICSTEWIPFFKQDCVDPKYICYFLQNDEFRNFLALNVSGVGGSLTRIRPQILTQYLIPLPPFNEQKRIVTKIEELFSELDSATELLNKVKLQLKQYERAFLLNAFDGNITADWRSKNIHVKSAYDLIKKIESARIERANLETGNKRQKKLRNLSKISIIQKNSRINSWLDVKLENLVYISGRIGWRGLKADEYTTEGPLFLSVYNLNNGRQISYENVTHISKKRYDESPEIQLEENDILLVKDGSGIGKISIVKNLHEPATVNSSLLVIRSQEAFIPEFLFYFLYGPNLQNIAKQRITGSATPHLFQRDIKNFVLSLPPLEEQKEIIKRIENGLTILKNAESVVRSEYKKISGLKTSILKMAFNGNLVSQDPNDEPASVLLEKIKREKEQLLKTQKIIKSKPSKKRRIKNAK